MVTGGGKVVIINVAPSRTGGRGRELVSWSRKVRAPQGRELANGQGERSHGKCHREQTAPGTRAPG